MTRKESPEATRGAATPTIAAIAEIAVVTTNMGTEEIAATTGKAGIAVEMMAATAGETTVMEEIVGMEIETAPPEGTETVEDPMRGAHPTPRRAGTQGVLFVLLIIRFSFPPPRFRDLGDVIDQTLNSLHRRRKTFATSYSQKNKLNVTRESNLLFAPQKKTTQKIPKKGHSRRGRWRRFS